jgi:hypothetical protein
MRQGNVASLPLFIRQAIKKTKGHDFPSRATTLLRIEAARGFLVLGNLPAADELLTQASMYLPAMSLDLLGDITAAREVAEQIDCDEFERGKDSQPLFFRKEGEITSQTWMVLAEVALTQCSLDEARHFILQAGDRFARDEAERTGRLKKQGYAATRLATPGSKSNAQFAGDLHDNLRFLQAVWQIASCGTRRSPCLRSAA